MFHFVYIQLITKVVGGLLVQHGKVMSRKILKIFNKKKIYMIKKYWKWQKNIV